MKSILQEHEIVCTQNAHVRPIEHENSNEANYRRADMSLEQERIVADSCHLGFGKLNDVGNQICVKPQAPRNVKVLSTNHNSVLFSWDPPILIGGCPIEKIEVAFSMQSNKTIGKQIVRKKIPMSRIIFSAQTLNPQNQFMIEKLTAATKYCDIRLRCQNKVGWSPASAAVNNVVTSGKCIVINMPTFKWRVVAFDT